MDTLTVYAEQDCIGWDELNQVLSEFRAQEDVPVSVEVKSPSEYPDEFHGHGLVVCPSVLYDDELIVVGVPTVEELNQKVLND